MPFDRLRRLRRDSLTRDLAAETRLSADNFVLPYFIVEGRNKKEPIESMPGVSRLSVDNALKDIGGARALGIKAVLLFGICKEKGRTASAAYRKDGLIQQAIKAIKGEVKDVVVISDVCLCGYTSHGHCGIIKKSKSCIDNDETIKILVKIALTHVQAGADFVAPSAMMDGQVKAIRETLDKNGFAGAGILAYSAKYASNFYGPFREAMDSAPQFGDRKTYQMDYRNSKEALREIEADIKEGADIVMVKPALAYLDVIRQAKDNFNVPIAAYNVSGEYAMVKAYCARAGQAAGRECLERDLALEILTAIKRSGADLIISYHAKEAVKWLKR